MTTENFIGGYVLLDELRTTISMFGNLVSDTNATMKKLREIIDMAFGVIVADADLLCDGACAACLKFLTQGRNILLLNVNGVTFPRQLVFHFAQDKGEQANYNRHLALALSKCGHWTLKDGFEMPKEFSDINDTPEDSCMWVALPTMGNRRSLD